MNGTTLERPDMAAYLDAVRAKLADLPAEERDDLVADVEASLLESGEPPALSPEEFAAELREAAGLSSQSSVAASAPSALDALREWLSSERVASWWRTAHELAPIWWVARAFVAVAVVDAVSDGFPLGSGSVSFDWSIFFLLVAAAISVWFGLRGRRGLGPDRPRLGLVVNVALALAVLPVAAVTIDKLSYGGYSDAAYYYEPMDGLALNGTPIANLYPYSRDGEPLFDVLLYDENGTPIDIVSGSEDTSRRTLTAADGSRFFNSFPIRYFEPGTTTVAQPTLGPQVEVPEIVTPPLEVGSR